MEKLDEIDRKITRAMQGDFPLVEEPYKEIAAQVGIEEEELLRRLRRLKENGQIRKMGAVLQHRAAGYTSNVLCAWVVPPERMDETARCMCANPAVSHCYDRDTAEDWPYNVYTMIHAKSREECEAVAAALAAECGLEERVMLYSVKEWKKTSMRYFCEEEEGSA
ncbi:AsnC family transcriptional regulator [uncultured Selenomonas sp.]|uniref:siroheme decarboxylase subunit beta n=1 Tax=uncultured Selenomonas sp. TaxID=159275 RepID=UPI0028DC2BD8|nr:AsnC family transcriptional regulator [uncultured Selenomonas sp.]